LIGPAGSGFDLSGYTQFAVTYPSLTVEPTSAQISGNFVSGSPISLSSPFTSLSTSGLSVLYPTGDDPTTTFTLTAVGENGVSQTKTVSIVFPNYTYYGIHGYDPLNPPNGVITGDNMDDFLTSDLVLGSKLDSGYTIEVETGLDEYVWFCYPARHGLIRSVVEARSGQPRTDSFFYQGTESHTNAVGYTEDYHIYRASQENQGLEELTFSTA